MISETTRARHKVSIVVVVVVVLNHIRASHTLYFHVCFSPRARAAHVEAPLCGNKPNTHAHTPCFAHTVCAKVEENGKLEGNLFLPRREFSRQSGNSLCGIWFAIQLQYRRAPRFGCFSKFSPAAANITRIDIKTARWKR